MEKLLVIRVFETSIQYSGNISREIIGMEVSSELAHKPHFYPYMYLSVTLYHVSYKAVNKGVLFFKKVSMALTFELINASPYKILFDIHCSVW